MQPRIACFTISGFVRCVQPNARFRRETQDMAESDRQLSYRKEVNGRQKNCQDSIDRGASGESKAQLLRQIDAAEKLLEAIKTFKRESEGISY
jgi:hypothetical protein